MAALLRTKRIVWGAALFFASLVLLFSYVSGRKYMNALEWVEHTQQVRVTLERVLSGLHDQEADLRGYVLTGDAAFLADRATDQRTLERDVAHCRELVRDNPVEVERAAVLERLVREKLVFTTTAIALRERGDEVAARDLVATRRGKMLMDRIESAVKVMRAEEEQLLGRRRAEANLTQRETGGAIAALALSLLALLAGSFFNMQRDAADLREAAQELAESEERYRVLVDNVSDLVTLHAPDGSLRYVSPSVEALLGFARADCPNLPLWSLIHPEDRATARYGLQKFQAGEADSGVVTCRLRRSDGEYRWFEFKVTRVAGDDGGIRHFQAAGRDVTMRRQLEQRLADQAEELRHLSLRDGLTGLYNRRGFLELSGQLVRVAERQQHRLALLFVDLDGLKDINDELGHAHGDRAIAEAAELLRSTCRATDLVARLGGDEFVVLASDVNDDSIAVLTGRLDRALAEANEKAGRDFRLSFSLGVASFDPKAPVAIETLLGQADERMYEAKAQKRRPRSRPSELGISSYS
ncbi:MAG TPA: diguanylate cyclase [Polyangiaceae bacterium]|nr:diguanylate cyclase [Polyangiaceae bacterium]